MRALLYWFLSWCEVNYQTAYWESVAQNEAWLQLLMELTDDE